MGGKIYLVTANQLFQAIISKCIVSMITFARITKGLLSWILCAVKIIAINQNKIALIDLRSLGLKKAAHASRIFAVVGLDTGKSVRGIDS